MELYRGLSYSNIALNAGDITAAPAPYTTDKACGASPSDCSAANQVTIATALRSEQPQACAYRLVTGADNDPYRVDVYIKWTCALGTSRLIRLSLRLQVRSSGGYGCRARGEARDDRGPEDIGFDEDAVP